MFHNYILICPNIKHISNQQNYAWQYVYISIVIIVWLNHKTFRLSSWYVWKFNLWQLMLYK